MFIKKLKAFFAISVFAIYALLPSVALAQNFNFQALIGSYKGKVFNGGKLEPIVTVFTVSTSGKLIGNYTIDTVSGDSFGVLTNAIVESSDTLTMEWTDRDGEGLIQITFSNNFQQFDGFWGRRSGPERYPLDGKR